VVPFRDALATHKADGHKVCRPTTLTRVTAKAVIVPEVEDLPWRIRNGKAKNSQRSINRIR
jgi:hypothetical protein